jgi:hypothetical protein
MLYGCASTCPSCVQEEVALIIGCSTTVKTTTVKSTTEKPSEPAVITTTETPITTTQLYTSDTECEVDGDCRSARPICDVRSNYCMEENCCSELKLSSGNNGFVNGEKTIVSYVVAHPHSYSNYALFDRSRWPEWDGKRVWSADGGEIGPRGYGEWTFKEAQHVNLRFYLNWKSDTNSWEISYNPGYQGMMRNKNCTEDCPVNCPSSAWEYFDARARSWMKADDVTLECAREAPGLEVCLPLLEMNTCHEFAECAKDKFEEMQVAYEEKIFDLEQNNS